MEQKNLPIDDLKEYGIMNADNSFSNKLSENDVKKFLDGYVIVADNDKDRITFQLRENNSKVDLMVNTYQRDKSIDKILEDSKKEIQYVKQTHPIKPNNVERGNTFRLKSDKNEDLMITSVRRDENDIPAKIYFTDKNGKEFNIHYKDFLQEVFDINKNEQEYNVKVFVAKQDSIYKTEIKEYDLLKDVKELTKIVAERGNENESKKYKQELLKLKEFLQEKIDKFPEIAKQITENMNIVSNQINSVNSIDTSLNKNAEKSKIDLDVNDRDLYEDANREREEKEEIEQDKKRGRRR